MALTGQYAAGNDANQWRAEQTSQVTSTHVVVRPPNSTDFPESYGLKPCKANHHAVTISGGTLTQIKA